MTKIPLLLKIAFTAWMLIWVPSYLIFHGPENFLWLCDLGNFVILLALWTESRLLFSSQIVGLLLIDFFWTVDLLARLVGGRHLIGGTEYMFNPGILLPIRLMSLFHLFTPLIMLYAIGKLRYDRRGPLLQTMITWIVLPMTFASTTKETNINWVFGLFGEPQTVLPGPVYLALCMIFYPIILYLPIHYLAAWLFPNGGSAIPQRQAG